MKQLSKDVALVSALFLAVGIIVTVPCYYTIPPIVLGLILWFFVATLGFWDTCKAFGLVALGLICTLLLIYWLFQMSNLHFLLLIAIILLLGLREEIWRSED